MAAYCASDKAEQLNLDRKVLMAKLVHWLRWEDKGRAAFDVFSQTVRAEQRKEGLQLLAKALELPETVVKTSLFEVSDLNPVRERELQLVAYTLGLPKLTKQAKAHKALPLAERLRAILVPPEGRDTVPAS